ncbi:hypothetical protein PRIPAC_91131 [Pristionchus pacificus]|uniref:Uncharacterized protein n=1 Tax=Pristionchus pacificus TaxID=54126 RepID=A0A2A6CVL5_PRIPA|nr:hypothetical protein PRIPAC_91131 [Pristionchus pacificus]|eukprot:PDM82225.1 hypothetical protein PRIPAC_36618 [Pristionchus pacificus]
MMNSSEACSIAKSLISHSGIIAVHAVMILIAIIGSSMMIGLLSAIATYRVLQINLRMLLCSLSAVITVRSISTLGRSAFFLSLSGQTDCAQVVWLLWRCQSFANIISGPGFVTGYAFFALALERILALVLGNKYEDSTIPIVGAAVTAVVWLEYAYIVGVEWAALIVNDTARVSEGYLPYCTSVSHHGVSVTTRLVIPCAVTYYTIYIMTLIGAFIASSISSKGNLLLGTIIKELCSMGFNCYSIIFPLIMWKREPGLRFSLRKQPVDLHEPPVAAHFDVVTSMWECALPPGSRSTRQTQDKLRRKPRPLSPPSLPSNEGRESSVDVCVPPGRGKRHSAEI